MTGTLVGMTRQLDALGEQVKTARTKKGWSKEEAARRADISAITWKRVEDGLKVHDSKLAAVLRVLDEPEGVAVEPVGEDFVQFEISGSFGVRAIVKGPVRDIDALQAAALKLAAGLNVEASAEAPAT